MAAMMTLKYWHWIKRRRVKRGVVGGPSGDGIQLEAGDFLLAENGNYLILE